MKAHVLLLVEDRLPAEGDGKAVKAALLHLGVGHEVLLSADDFDSAVCRYEKKISLKPKKQEQCLFSVVTRPVELDLWALFIMFLLQAIPLLGSH